MGYLAVSGGADSKVNNSDLSCYGVMDFLGSLHVRTKVDSTVLVEVQTVASYDAFSDDGAEHPIFSSNRVIPKDDARTIPIVSDMGILLNGFLVKPAQQLSLVVCKNCSASGT